MSAAERKKYEEELKRLQDKDPKKMSAAEKKKYEEE